MVRPTEPDRVEEGKKRSARALSTDPPAAPKRTPRSEPHCGEPHRGAPPADATGYREFLELTRDGVWRYDVVPSVSIRLPADEQARLILSRARLGFCNLAFARLCGFDTPEDLLGLPLPSLLAGTDEERLRFVAESVRAGYRLVDVEAVTRDREGRSLRTLNNVAGVVKRGCLVGGWGASRDISGQREAEAALEEAHADLRATLAAFPDLVFEVDGEGRIFQYHAPDPGRLYASPMEFLGKCVSDVLPADAARVVLDALGEAARYGSHHGAKYGLDFPSGRRWFELSMARKGPDQGAQARYIAVARDVTDQENARVALQASEEKYRLLVENAGEAIFVAQDGIVRFSNLATPRLVGRSKEDVASRPFAELIHPDDRAMVVDRYRRRVAGEDVESGYVVRLLHADGSTRWVRNKAVRVEWEGRPATLNFVDDVTERRAAEAALIESEARFRRIFEESPIGMVTAGPDYRFTRANEAFCRMLGYSEDELRELRFTDITHPDHLNEDLAGVQRAARGDIRSYRAEKRYIRKDGGVVWASVASSPVRDADGRVQYFLAMIEDITAAKEARAALAESERRFREMANALPTCVFEADLDGRLTYANRTGLEWFGYAEDETVGSRSVFDMVAPEQRDIAARTFCAAAETGGVPAGEYTAVRKDGTTFPALVSSRAMVRGGKTIGVRAVLIDIRERVEAARQVERALTGTIHALALTTEMRDPYTAGHQERVARLAIAIGNKLGLSRDRVEGLRVAGLLHDVGKVSVPAEILSKPTELSAIEMGLVRSHAETGYTILREIDFRWPVADAVLQHHERMDGSGYPKGLRGDEILLEARILAVADSVEAMASHRPYRAAFGVDYALAEIDRGRGTAYDEAVASACLAVFVEDGFQFDA